MNYLELNSSRELKDNILASELLVDSRESVNLVFKRGGILSIKENLESLGTIDLLTESLTNDFSRENEVIQDSIMDSSQSARSGTGLLTVVTTAGNSQDTTLSNENNMTVRELLFELTSKTSLDLVETRLAGDRDKDDNSLLTGTELDLKNIILLMPLGHIHYLVVVTNLLGSRDMEGTETLQVRNAGLQVNESLGNREFELISSWGTSLLNNLVRSHLDYYIKWI